VAERSSGWVQNSGPTGVMDVEETRLAVAALVMPGSTNFKAKSGFRPGPGASPGLVTATGTPDGFVHVAPFQLLLQSGRATAPGTYETALDAIKDINILSTPADPTNPRDDLIVAQQSDTFYADANSDFLVRHVVGTPAGVPVDPTVTGSPDFITLARVRVNATATTITSGNITDLRTGGHANSLTGGLHSVALGGILPVTSAAQRDALVGVYEGLTIDRADLDYAERHNGSVWRPFVSGQRTAPGGAFPLNTHGGGLSYTHPGMYGIFTIVEAVRQLRHDYADAPERQVGGARIGLAHGTGGVLSATGTLILTRD